jgi:hypothetical protein
VQDAISPLPGDVLIARDDTRQPASYLISVVPSAPQMRYASYEQALVLATAWASQHATRMWVTDDGKTFTAIDARRRGARRAVVGL